MCAPAALGAIKRITIVIISQRVVASTPLACTQLLTCCTPQTSCALWMYAHAESNTRYMHVRMYSHVLHAADKSYWAHWQH